MGLSIGDGDPVKTNTDVIELISHRVLTGKFKTPLKLKPGIPPKNRTPSERTPHAAILCGFDLLKCKWRHCKARIKQRSKPH